MIHAAGSRPAVEADSQGRQAAAARWTPPPSARQASDSDKFAIADA